MRVDAALLDHAIGVSHSRAVLRLYRWSGPVLSIGAHQRLSAGMVARCAARGVEVVRRPTGGTAVLHGDDLTYSVVTHAGGRGVLEAYRWVAGGLIAGLARLGIQAQVGARRPNLAPPGPADALADHSACFATTVGADLRVGEAKICGSAQLRRSGYLLQHGSIPLADSRPLTRELLHHPGSNNSACLDELSPGITWEEVAVCLVAGFEQVWGPAQAVSLQEFFPVELAG